MCFVKLYKCGLSALITQEYILVFTFYENVLSIRNFFLFHISK